RSVVLMARSRRPAAPAQRGAARAQHSTYQRPPGTAPDGGGCPLQVLQDADRLLPVNTAQDLGCDEVGPSPPDRLGRSRQLRTPGVGCLGSGRLRTIGLYAPLSGKSPWNGPDTSAPVHHLQLERQLAAARRSGDSAWWCCSVAIGRLRRFGLPTRQSAETP